MSKFIERLAFDPATTHKIYGLISQIDELKGQWKMGANFSPQVSGLLKRSVIVTSSGASTRIEGARLTDEEVEKLLKGLKIKKLVTRDEQEVVGYAELLTNVFDSYKTLALSESTIKHFHSELLKYSEKDIRHRGEYKFGSNRVEAKDASGNLVGVLFDPTPPHLVKKEMNELLEVASTLLSQKEIHPLIIIGNFIFEFLSIHPFQDGNGRTSRVLTNLLLLQSGYEYIPYISHEKLIEDNKDEYYLALNKSQKTWKMDREDISPWLLFFLNILLKQTQLAIGLLSKKSIENLLSAKQLAVWDYFNECDIVTPKNLRDDLKIAVPTITQILNKLLEMNKIERMGEGRATRYKRTK
ncbi:cell filamentation protein Fic [Candidatus Falkowbacteria bacterium CG23_combo_of_CG06-09_8_20_14_all_41_10]|uniref:Cell filamentation protein Fic n=1 Tax=Candidatus Falkowbacteria bacterium CG23_combo_of_CG06-09_8_20_14_all_41_10 TaxID=1974571 RepID=A0A2G9ZMZ9_9BACT|nr:MAG: cell filamentation protein Fic [Candidatus Falkowbacteria bacterium CG23_combo_of_CG06-09_8_20_14_all_41_10]